ncbi:hypothetical protein NDU88_007213 [Pleurodeles waltl]|uniref:Uncharacterized protein n=1 Tax=Pleurodeles waltl TaxID=8319 RepID=A0AAV7RNS6_PLEWA|nr:hypothetical protein NDU88_007213 [Pleurodeles waltl]
MWQPAPAQLWGRAASPMPPCPARARCRVCGPAPAHTGAAPAFSSSAALPLHGAGPSGPPGPCRPPQHLRSSGETRPGSQPPPARPPLPRGRVRPATLSGAATGGPAAPRASPQFSAPARAQIGPEMARFSSTF